jgi:hypothetical protein
MSGSRCKALKREFKNRFARAPSMMEVTKVNILQGGGEQVSYKQSEWRRLKKEYRRMRRQPNP